MKDMKTVEVSAAMIRRGGKVLLCRRNKNSKRALKWEFPGGKLNDGETGEEALVREIGEELDCLISVKGALTDVTYEYPDITIHMTLYECSLSEGEPSALEHEEIRWVDPDDIVSYDLCPADRIMTQSLGLR